MLIGRGDVTRQWIELNYRHRGYESLVLPLNYTATEREGFEPSEGYYPLEETSTLSHSVTFLCCLETPYKGLMLPEGNNRNDRI